MFTAGRQEEFWTPRGQQGQGFWEPQHISAPRRRAEREPDSLLPLALLRKPRGQNDRANPLAARITGHTQKERTISGNVTPDQMSFSDKQKTAWCVCARTRVCMRLVGAKGTGNQKTDGFWVRSARSQPRWGEPIASSEPHLKTQDGRPDAFGAPTVASAQNLTGAGC